MKKFEYIAQGRNNEDRVRASIQVYNSPSLFEKDKELLCIIFDDGTISPAPLDFDIEEMKHFIYLGEHFHTSFQLLANKDELSAQQQEIIKDQEAIIKQQEIEISYLVNNKEIAT